MYESGKESRPDPRALFMERLQTSFNQKPEEADAFINSHISLDDKARRSFFGSTFAVIKLAEVYFAI